MADYPDQGAEMDVKEHPDNNMQFLMDDMRSRPERGENRGEGPTVSRAKLKYPFGMYDPRGPVGGTGPGGGTGR